MDYDEWSNSIIEEWQKTIARDLLMEDSREYSARFFDYADVLYNDDWMKQLQQDEDV